MMDKDPNPIFILSAICCEPNCTQKKSEHDSNCFFQVRSLINPYMKPGSVDVYKALQEHDKFAEALMHCGAEIIKLPFLHGSFDSVFMKDNALFIDSTDGLLAILGNPRHETRKSEPHSRRKKFEELGFDVRTVPSLFEGGDFVMLPNQAGGFLGCGFRSERSAAGEISQLLGLPIETLDLVDPHFYHLDTAMNFISIVKEGKREVICFLYPEAFSKKSLDQLKNSNFIKEFIPVNRAEALKFGLNWVEAAGTVILGNDCPGLIESLKSFGKNVEVQSLSQFQLAGGSAACLTARIFPTRVSQKEASFKTDFEIHHEQFIN